MSMVYPRRYLRRQALSLLVALTAAVALTGCPSAGGTDGDTAPDTAANPAEAQSATTGQAATPAPGSTPAVPGSSSWTLDGFSLGMAVADARALISAELTRTVNEQWRVEETTGMLIVGSYNEPPHMVGSLMFLDGKLVAVLKNQREEYDAFQQQLDALKTGLGEPAGETPEFAQGRAFIAEMLADERRPDEQYLWGNDVEQWLLIAGYYFEDGLSSYMLIDADKYDDMAAELAAAG